MQTSLDSRVRGNDGRGVFAGIGVQGSELPGALMRLRYLLMVDAYHRATHGVMHWPASIRPGAVH
ncbi:MAG: hypothetical protein DI597_00535 [Pseudoxanthomonas spadix]|nr:MAG: hypothetical protein DI597_00535 [Pseudoxanthomonas spadix]